MKLLALCFPRPGELRLAEWNEFDLDSDNPLWTVPASRMKMRKEHLVPLSPQAVAILKDLHKLTGDSKHVLARSKNAAIGRCAFGAALLALGWRGKHLPHGFRVTGSTLLHEQGHATDVIEVAQSRKRRGVAGVYNRSDLLSQRRELLQKWADFLGSLSKRQTSKAAARLDVTSGPRIRSTQHSNGLRSICG